MPHVPQLELRPVLQEPEEMSGDPDDPGTTHDNADDNSENVDEANAGEIKVNTIFHDLEEAIVPKSGISHRVKRFISKIKGNNGNIAAGGIELN